MSTTSWDISGTALAGVKAFSKLDLAQREEIAGLCVGKRFDKDQLIVSRLDNTRDVFFIVSGTVRVIFYSKSGKEITFRDETAGRMFGEISAIDGEPRSAHILALSDVSLAFVSPENFWIILRKYPLVAEEVFKSLARLVRRLSDRVVEISTLGVKNRIHAELFRLGLEQMGDDKEAIISPPPTHADIASKVSTHREAVTREISSLTQSGIIGKSAGALIIKDMDRLQRMVVEVIDAVG